MNNNQTEDPGSNNSHVSGVVPVALKRIQHPEIFIGIVAPIGVDTKFIVGEISRSLKAVGYNAMHIKLTELMLSVPTTVNLDQSPPEARYNTHIKYANEVRELFSNTGEDQKDGNAALAMLTVAGIREARKQITGSELDPAEKQAYILDQFKRPEEVKLIRKVYGRLFMLFSIHSSTANRRKVLKRKIRAAHGDRSKVNVVTVVEDLIARDQHEERVLYGQRVRETFPLADVVIDGNDKKKSGDAIRRSIQLFFGNNFITPTRDEYGMYLAKAAALRSADLSRQVGAAIFSSNGEIITLGANEVPKPGGGTYFEGDEPDHRDFAQGVDYNEEEKRAMAREVIERMRDADVLKLPPSNARGEALDDVVDFMMNDERGPLLKESRVMDVLEFGRQIHAEMSALIDAARLGKSVNGGTLYCTTFPCHMCTKLILGSGIKRVVYIEPYPKSFAEEMYGHSIALESRIGTDEPHVLFEPFTGIAPFRYRDFFEKGRRKDKLGFALEWLEDEPMPNVSIQYLNYRHFEIALVASLKDKRDAAEKAIQARK
jgi:cytidine deaminase